MSCIACCRRKPVEALIIPDEGGDVVTQANMQYHSKPIEIVVENTEPQTFSEGGASYVSTSSLFVTFSPPEEK